MFQKKITIGSHFIEIPIIQGGMGIGVSRCRLAGAVAAEGGMGVVSAAQIGYDDPDFAKHPIQTNLRILPEQIRRAKELSGGKGMIGVNIMAVNHPYGDYVKAACEGGADAIITGAGLPTTLPKYVEGTDTAIAPIVSGARSAQVILKAWGRKFQRTADFLVIEGPRAGGHLGFTREELADITALDYDAQIREILKVKAVYEEKYGVTIPVFLAGGMFTSEDIQHALSLGVDGVQAASRFVATEECDASDAFKQAYVNAKEEDIAIIKSPVGMPGRAIRNAFIRRMETAPDRVTHCYQCLKACNPAKAPYCISKALINAVEGNLDEGLIFCGSRIGEIREITTVHQVVSELLSFG